MYIFAYMKEKVVIFKASEDMVKTIKSEAKKRKLTQSGLIRACIEKALNYQERVL